MRRAFSELIVEFGERDKSVVLLCGDFGYGVVDEFARRFPERFFNMGICEQSMIGAASGMALVGLKPWVYTITPFLIERPFEQLKLDIDQQNVNVKLVGYADYPEQGPTHAEIDAFALMAMFENIVSYYPTGMDDTEAALWAMYQQNGPSFISLKKHKGG